MTAAAVPGGAAGTNGSAGPDGPAAPVRAAVLGAGAWGTTFAQVLADAGAEVRVWGRDAAVCAQITAEHRNPRYLGEDVVLPEAVVAGTDAAWALDGADLVAVAIPAQVARATLAPLAALVPPDAVVVSLVKGVELATDRRMSEVIAEALAVPATRVAVLSGPNLAREIAQRQPTATVVAAAEPETAQRVAAACASAYFRPYTSADVVGVELCGAVKNVIAIAAGMAQGRGLGGNTLASLVTRGLAEITRLGLELGADARTFAGLAGMGDLMATCGSPDSRNHALGVRMGRGMTLSEALAASAGTAEGVKTSASVLELATSVGVEMPITAAVAAVLADRLSIDDMAGVLLGRPRKTEGV